MKAKRTEKKNFFRGDSPASIDLQSVNTFIINGYADLFRVYRMSSTHTAVEYVAGLLRCEKGSENMERMTEKIEDSDYKRYIHFLSTSKWSASDVNHSTLVGANALLVQQKLRSGQPTGLVIDETSHLKKGDKSVGVSRQYAGVIGKVENCQVSVHTSLANERFCTLVGSALFLPESWTSAPERCENAGIPEDQRCFKTKPELALQLIKEAVAANVEFDFIGGDGLYGHNSELTRALDEMGLFYVLDVHKDETVFLSEPTFSIPERKGSKGRMPKCLRPNIEPIQLQEYLKTLKGDDFTTEKVRKTAKGWKVVKVHTVTVWHWDGKEERAQKRTLLITRSDRVKFSLSNGEKDEYTNKQWAYFQCSRYWVERCFDDSKNELGMSGYQVRGWLSWQHHMALVLMAGLYILSLKIEHQDEMPLLSVRDARLLVIAVLFATQKEVDVCLEHINARHRKRKADIYRYYRRI